MTDKKNDRKVKEVLQDQELDKVIGGMVILVSYSFEHKLPPRGGFFLPKNYSLSGSFVSWGYRICIELKLRTLKTSKKARIRLLRSN